MNKIITIAAILSLVLVASMLMTPIAHANGPPLKRPMDIYVATIEGGSPQSVDYSWIYDTASAEIVFNSMDTLFEFDGEAVDRYVPSLGTSYRLDTLTPANGSDSGIPIAGLTFENPVNQSGINATYYYRYVVTFNNTFPIYFQPPYSYQLTPTDIVYSFQRTLVQDRYTGPSWMLYEPLLDNNFGGDYDYGGGVAHLTVEAEVNKLGRLLEKAVMVNPGNPNEIWFNVMFPGAYAPFLQILTQTWSCIISKQWIVNQVIGAAGRPDWDGNFALVKSGWTLPNTEWVVHHNPVISPLDSPTPMCYGSGPFIITTGTPDYVSKFWAAYRNVGYWRGWPAPYPVLNQIKPAGFANTIEVTWAFTWATRKTMYLNGDCDFCALPSTAYINELYQSNTPPFEPPNWPLKGVRCIKPLPTLIVTNIFMTFNISKTSTFEIVGNANDFDPNNIPPDFFGNPTWGVYVRRAFAKAFNYANYLATALRNEGRTPATALIQGLQYHDPSILGYSYNIAAARADLEKAVDKNGDKLVNVGARIKLYYNTGNLARKTGCELLQAGLALVCSNLTVEVINIDWGPYLTAAVYNNLAIFAIGWQADFPDPHDFVLPFYRTGGSFSLWQAYSNSTIDALIDKGIVTPDGPARAAIYHDLQVLFVEDVPSFPISQAVARHFERDWITGWYYNPIYPGGHYYTEWKWYYIPEVLFNTSINNINQPNSTYLPADLTYDGKVQIDDVAGAAKAFGAVPGVSRWMFRADITGDRKIQIDDVAYISKQFGKKDQPKWAPQGLLVYITPVVQWLNATQAWTWTSTVSGGTGPYTYVWSANGTAYGGNTATLAFTPLTEGLRYLQLNVTDSTAKFGQSELAWVTSAPLTVAIDPSDPADPANGTALDVVGFSSTVAGGTLNSTLEGGYHYQWYSNQTGGVVPIAVAGATHPTYNLETTAADIGKVIEVYLIVTDESTNPGPQVVKQSASTHITVIA